MATKVKEIHSNPHGDPSQCSICNPRKDTIGADQAWGFSRANPGVQVLKDSTRV